jgi:hypothetical protein
LEKAFLKKKPIFYKAIGGFSMKKMIAVFGILTILLAGLVSAHARWIKLPPMTGEVREQFTQAIENNDLDAFIKTYQDNGLNVPNRLTQERFVKISEKQGFREKTETAIQQGNYKAWVDLMNQTPNPMNQMMLSVITEENFGLLKELKDARQAGDFERAREIMQELGLGFGLHKMGGHCFGINSNKAATPLQSNQKPAGL